MMRFNKEKHVGRAFLWNMIGSTCYAVSSFVYLMAVTRVCGEVVAGFFSLSYATAQLLLSIGRYGMRTYQATDLKGEYTFAEYGVSRFLTCAAMMAFGVAYSGWCFDGDKILISVFIILLKMTDAVEDVYHGNFQRNYNVELMGKTLAARNVFSAVLFTLVLCVSGSLYLACAATAVLSLGACLLLNGLATRRSGPPDAGRPGRPWRMGNILRLLKGCTPLFAGTFLSLLLYNIPKYAMSGILTDDFQTYYSILFMPTFVITLLCEFLFKPTITTIAALWWADERRRFALCVLRILGLIFLGGAAVVGAGHFIGRPLLELFYGVDLDPYKLHFVVLLVSGGIGAAVYMIYNILIAIRKGGCILPVYAIAAVLTILPAAAMVRRWGVMGACLNYALSCTILFVLFGLILMKTTLRVRLPRLRAHWTVPVLAALFSAFTLIGIPLAKNGTLDSLVNGRILSVLSFALLFAFFFFVVKGAYFLLDKASGWSPESSAAPGRFLAFVRKHAFLTAFGVLLLCWLPWIVVFYPASVPFDGMYMLLEGTRAPSFGLSDHHGWLTELVMGAVFNIGLPLGEGFALFLVVFAFALFELLCYASVCKLVSRWRVPGWVTPALILFFAIYPVFPVYAQTIIKDAPFMAAFTLYTALYLDVCLGHRRKMELAALLGAGLFVCILRNNGPHLVLPSLLLLAFLIGKGFRRHAVALFAGAAVFVFLYRVVLPPVAGVAPSGIEKRSKLFLPFQITGRYLRDFPKDLTEEEAQVLKKIFSGLPELGGIYDPELADPVKKRFNNAATPEELRDYIRVVGLMAKRHPRVCLEAVLNQTYGYYYPFRMSKITNGWYFYIQKIPSGGVPRYGVEYARPYSVRKAFADYASGWRTLPVLSILTNPALPTWGLLLLAGYLAARKRYREILPFAASALSVAIFLLSPVNGDLRYAMPCLAVLPLLVLWTVLAARREPPRRGRVGRGGNVV